MRRPCLMLRAPAVAALLVAIACSPAPSRSPEAGSTAGAPGRTLTLGDVDPHTPTWRVRRLQPLAERLASALGDVGIAHGRAIVSGDFGEMAAHLRDGSVDVYIDSAFPTLAVRERAGSRVVLVNRVRRSGEYWSVFAVRNESPARGLADLRGRVIAFQEPFSTSGFLMPAGLLMSRGLRLVEARSPGADVPPEAVGYLFSGDEENSVELIARGAVAAVALSNQVLDDLPPERRRELRVLERTRPVPRRLVSLRGDLDGRIAERVVEEMLALTEEESAEIGRLGGSDPWDWLFSPLPPDAEEVLAELSATMALLDVG